jgi:hypothetical protein
MAMAAPVIVAEKLTLTGSIGVVTGIFILCCDVRSRLQTSLLNQKICLLASLNFGLTSTLLVTEFEE